MFDVFVVGRVEQRCFGKSFNYILNAINRNSQNVEHVMNILYREINARSLVSLPGMLLNWVETNNVVACGGMWAEIYSHVKQILEFNLVENFSEVQVRVRPVFGEKREVAEGIYEIENILATDFFNISCGE